MRTHFRPTWIRLEAPFASLRGVAINLGAGSPDRYGGEPDRERLKRDLLPICMRGYAFYSELIDRLAGLDAAGDSRAEELTTLMRAPGSVQIALLGPPRSVLPAALIYDYDLEGGRKLTEYAICEQFLEDLEKPNGLHELVCFKGAWSQLRGTHRGHLP